MSELLSVWNMSESLLFLQVSELLLQCGHLIQALHPPPLTVFIVHLCSHTDMTALTTPPHHNCFLSSSTWQPHTALHTQAQPVSPFLREITRTVKHINYTRVGNTSLTVGWCSRPIFPTRAVSIFRHGRAHGILLVCCAAVLLGKVHLHFFVVAFFLLPRVDRHCDCQISRC